MNININNPEDIKKFKTVVDQQIKQANNFFDQAEAHKEETLFSIEVGHSTWYIDYDRPFDLYNVHKDEKFRVQRKSLGDALEYIFGKLGGTRLKLIK